MADEQGAGAPQDDNQQPIEGQQPDAGASDAQTASPDPAPKPDSANQLIKQFAKERGVTVEQLIDQFKTYEDATKTEREKLEADLARYKADAEASTNELREFRAREALREAVSQIPNVYDASTVVDLALPLITFGDDGTPTNTAEALESLRERRPKLFPAAAGSADGGKGGGNPTGNDLNAAMRAFMQGGGTH